MGYFDDQEGIVRRFINEGSNWNEHLKNTKQFIEKSISKVNPGNVAVLGSGWMLDIPLEFLSENCSKVFLYDVRHPRQIVHRYRYFSNVSFVNQDITGGAIQEVYSIMDKRKPDFEKLNQLKNTGFSSSEPIDYVVSVNVLNQLDILILEYLRKNSLPKDFSLIKMRTEIQEGHIRSLKAGKSCLITDYEELVYDASDKLLKTNSLLFAQIPDATGREEWIWKFDTQMTYYPTMKTFFKVLAIEI